MLLRTILMLCLVLNSFGCKKNDTPDPDENIQSYITFKADGQEYIIRNGGANQYIQYRIEHDQNSTFGYILDVGGADSVTKVPSFGIFVKGESQVVQGKYINSYDLTRKFESGMGAILPQYNNAADYIGYWSSFDAMVEISELNDLEIKGSFYGSVTTNSDNFPSKTLKISEGTFFVNRRPGFSRKYKI